MEQNFNVNEDIQEIEVVEEQKIQEPEVVENINDRDSQVDLGVGMLIGVAVTGAALGVAKLVKFALDRKALKQAMAEREEKTSQTKDEMKSEAVEPEVINDVENENTTNI